jgi:hypothetical protein
VQRTVKEPGSQSYSMQLTNMIIQPISIPEQQSKEMQGPT